MAASLARDSALIVRGVLGHVSHELPILNIAPEVPSGMGAQPVVCHGLYRTLSVDLIEVYKGEHASPLTVHIQSGFECCVDIDPPFFDSYEAGQEWIFFLRPGGKTIFPEGTHRPVSEWIVRRETSVVAKHDGRAPAPLDDVEQVLRHLDGP